MRGKLGVFVVAAACAVAACGGDDSAGKTTPGGDGGADGTAGGDAALDGASDNDGSPSGDGATDAQATDGGEGGVVTGVAYVRVVDLSPDALPFDVCFSAPDQPSDFSHSQPLLKARQPTGVGYLDVSAFGQTPSGRVARRIVAPNANDCSAAIDGIADATVTLASQSFSTIVVSGSLLDAGGAALTTTVLVDDAPLVAIADGGMTSTVRVVSFAPGHSALDVGKGSLTDGDYAALFTKLAYATPATGSGVDANGYVAAVTISGDRVSVHDDGAAADLAIFPGVSVDIGVLTTVFLAPAGRVSDGDGGTKPVAIRGVLCTDDYAQPKTGGLNPKCAELAQ